MIIPNYFPIQEDETILSWLRHLATVNGLPNESLFVNVFLDKNQDPHKRINTIVDIPIFPQRLITSEMGNISMKSFIQNHSVLPFIWPFLSENRQDLYIQTIFRKDRRYVAQNIPTFINAECWCPLCRKEHGEHYLHRLHQVPGMKICHIHGCPLETKSGKLAITPAARKFAYFLGSSTGWPKTSLKQLIPAVHSALKNLNASDFFEQLVSSGSVFQSVEEVEMFLKNLQSSYNPDFEKLCTICSYLFSSIPAMVAALTNVSDTLNLPSEYSLVEDWGCGVYTVAHNCGCSFITTSIGFRRGFHCPECSKKLDEKALLKRLISSVGNFELLDYNTHNYTAKICCTTCMHTFCVQYRKFLKFPFCRICRKQRYTVSGFQAEITSLTGNDYTLVSPYKGRKTNVTLRHICDEEFDVAPRHFLRGCRCSKCTPFLTPDRLRYTVDLLSDGRYQVQNILKSGQAEIFDTATHKLQTIDRALLLQELRRPTPSNIIVNRASRKSVEQFKELDLPDFHTLELCDFMQYIRAKCPHGTAIFMTDFSDFDQYKRLFSKAKKSSQLVWQHPGIYTYPGESFSDESLAEQAYICRNKKIIGYWFAETFLYMQGFIESKPERLQIATNMDPLLHGRNTHVGACQLKIRSGRCEITAENDKALAIMDILSMQKHYEKLVKNNFAELLHNYILKNSITKKQLFDLLHIYPQVSASTIQNLLKGTL